MPAGKVLLRHMRGAIDVGLREHVFYTNDLGDPGHVTTVDGDIDTQEFAEFVVESMTDGDIDTQEFAEFVVESMTAMGWTFTKKKRM